MTVAEMFQQLLEDSEVSDSLSSAADLHIASIRGRLKQSFRLKKLEKVGSFARGTFVPGFSDVDVFAVISRDDARWGDGYMSSSTVLKQFREELADRFPNTDIGRDGQAIVVGFRDCEIDVVPAIYGYSTTSGWPVYSMPDGSGGWMETSPGYHGWYLRGADTTARGKLRRAARLLKIWRVCRSLSISSFYIEMVMAHEEICNGPRTYRECVAHALACLNARKCQKLRDPIGISGLIPAAKTERQIQGAINAVRYSAGHAVAALEAEANGDTNEALRQWGIVFNRQLSEYF